MKYISRTLKLQATSHTSQFFREWKRYTILSKEVILERAEEEYEEDDIQQIQIKFIEEELKKMNLFSALLWNRYIQKDYSAQVLADELVIPLSTCQYHIRKVKKTIRDNWKKNKGNYGN
jgi:predicted DNA binding protein